MKRLLLFLMLLYNGYYNAQCGQGTPSFSVNLTWSPSATWVSPSVVRADTCCGWTGTDVCIKFTFTLHPQSMGINFGIFSGASPPGALFYSINCGPPVSVGTPICLSGTGPHVLTFCKPGNNANSYSISAIPSPVVPDSILVRNGCTQTLSVSGFSVPTITWNSINPGPPGAYNSFLNCTSGCATVAVTPTGNPPPFVDYIVGGFGQSPCQAAYFQDTIRVYFFSDLLAGINPTLSTICAGSTSAILTATASGGLPPYTYSWSPIVSSATTVTVGPGTYTVRVFDNTGCPPTSATAVVNQFTLPISANAGPDKIICKSSPTVVLTGTVVNATGGVWSGGTGSFSPVSNSLITNYIPTVSELTSGVQLFLTTTGNSGCPPKQDTVFVSFQDMAVTNAGSDFTVCANNSSVVLTGTVSGFSSSGQWSSSQGTITSPGNLSTVFFPGSTTGTVNVILTSTLNGVCPPSSDTAKVFITPSPTVFAGPDQTICSNSAAVLSGTVTGPSSTGVWSTLGNGNFTPTNTLNSNYVPGSNDISAGSVALVLMSTNHGNCLAVTDTMVLILNNSAVVNAGANQVICSATGSVNLNGNVSGGSTTGVWTTSGNGSFSPSALTLNGVYNISANDISNGVITLSLTSTNNGSCPPVVSTTSILIVPIATLSAGPSQTICSNSATVSLLGSINGPATPVWTAGSLGSFNPANTVINPIFNLTQNDINNGFVTFTLSSANNTPCPVVTSTTQVFVIRMATVTAGPVQSVCATENTVILNGSVMGSTNSGFWSTSGSGAFNPGSFSLNTTYFFSASDINNGQVNFTLTSGANAPCPVITSTTTIYIRQLAIINAGPDQTICSSSGTVSLSGFIGGGATTATWSSVNNGAFTPTINILNPVYNLNSNDIINGLAHLVLTSDDNGPCPIVSDSVRILVIRAATVNAGPDQTICSTQSATVFNGTITGASGAGNWSAIGSGNFLPATNSLSVNYSISSGDITTGNVLLILSSTGNGVCPVSRDTARLIIIRNPVIQILADTTICEKQNPFTVKAIVSGGTGTTVWSSSGNGSFTNTNAHSTSYYFSQNDVNSGFVNLTISSINNGPCGTVSGNMKLNIKPSPTADFAPSTYTAYIPNDPIKFNNLSTGANVYHWNFSDGNTSNMFEPIHNYPVVGFYDVILVATNQYNCSDTARKRIKVISDIQFPTAFTPNLLGSNGGSYRVDDYSNDVFFPYTAGVIEYNLMIFNRWGELIFESNDIAIGWDGYFNGKPCQQDAYVWKATVKFFDNRIYKKVGSVTLVR
jgi:gliding motility-associated-like protein